MPQTFQVLRCYKCFVFQVHQTKKSNKWECKICGEKQSIKRHYGIGSAKDCRIHVQKLNKIRGDLDAQKNNEDQESGNSENDDYIGQPMKDSSNTVKDSKWANYIKETEIIEEDDDENMTLGDAQVVLEVPKKRRNQYNYYSKRSLNGTVTQHRHENENCESEITPPENVHSIKVNDFRVPTIIPAFNWPSDQIIETIKQVEHNTLKKKFIPPVMNKNSKWAQFAEDFEESEQRDSQTSPTLESSQHDLIFSLCDDRDLDDVLNI